MSPVKIGVLISGGGTNLQALIDNIENKNINGRIDLIISNKPGVFGLERGKNHNIESLFVNPRDFSSRDQYDRDLIKRFTEKNIELIVLAGYLNVLTKDFIEEFKGRIINIHPSLIPSFSGKDYYGDKVHRAVLDYGVKFTGASVHFVDEGTDTGPIILQEVVKIEDNDNLESLKEKVLEVEHKILVQGLKLYCDRKLYIRGRKVMVKGDGDFA